MSVKKARRLPARAFRAKLGPGSGSVTLEAPNAGDRAGYEWAQSTDGKNTWVSLGFTVNATFTVRGLEPGSTAYFRYRAVTKDGTGNWSDPVSIIVN